MKYYPIGGWNTCKFIVTPQELKEILEGFHLVEFCRWYFFRVVRVNNMVM